MTSNEQRSEVAARLRKNEPSSFGSVFDVWREIALAVNPNGGSYRTLPLELADLIEPEPERTCHMEPTFIGPATLFNMQEYECSKCGKSTFSQVFGDDEDVPKYCSECGAKVMER